MRGASLHPVERCFLDNITDITDEILTCTDEREMEWECASNIMTCESCHLDNYRCSLDLHKSNLDLCRSNLMNKVRPV